MVFVCSASSRTTSVTSSSSRAMVCVFGFSSLPDVPLSGASSLSSKTSSAPSAPASISAMSSALNTVLFVGDFLVLLVVAVGACLVIIRGAHSVENSCCAQASSSQQISSYLFSEPARTLKGATCCSANRKHDDKTLPRNCFLAIMSFTCADLVGHPFWNVGVCGFIGRIVCADWSPLEFGPMSTGCL